MGRAEVGLGLGLGLTFNDCDFAVFEMLEAEMIELFIFVFGGRFCRAV